MNSMNLIKFLPSIRTGGARILMGAAFLGLLCVSASPARAVGLKSSAVVQGPSIMLGDVFTGLEGPLEEKASRVLGPAPAPGETTVLNARTLLRISMAMDLPWRPAGAERIVINRAATMVNREEIEEALKDALEKKGVSGPVVFEIPEEQSRMALPADQPGSVEIGNFSIDPARGRFEAVLLAPSASAPLQRLNVSGSYERLIEVPVLKESLIRGTIIGQRDIQMVEMRERDLKTGVLRNAEDVVGTAAGRTLTAGLPVRSADIEAPRIVKRGDFVTMIFSSGPLSMTVQGKALEHGVKGDVIRVTNTASNKTIEAIVTASKEVAVQSF
ncbi:MAG: flagellar basal body P-ring formation chaperone FlgA [Alphaproteobacteria bacterium]|nr:flagellar basal body P-ring formation chaperone FlgA [Alphaproteobacteria bacterium]